MWSKARITAKQHFVKGLARLQIAFKLETVHGAVPKIGPPKAGPTGLVPPSIYAHRDKDQSHKSFSLVQANRNIPATIKESSSSIGSCQRVSPTIRNRFAPRNTQKKYFTDCCSTCLHIALFLN